MGGSTGTPFGDGSYIPDPLAQFLSRVVPWGDASYVNIHAFGGNTATPFKGGGRAYGSMADYGHLQSFVGYLNHIQAQVFFCISSKSQHEGMANGQRRASRKREHVHQLRSLVVDLDVKPTGYPSQAAALAAWLPFCDELGLKPGPIVSTGWGLHAYIVFDQPISRTQWQALADRLIEAGRAKGLKFDVGVTRDANRVLRLPTSFNRKDKDNPKECRVLSLGETMTLAEVTAALSGFPLTSGVSHPKRAAVIDPAILPPRPPIRGPEANRALASLAAARVVTSIDLLRRACPVVADSERRGGDTDLEPLWFELAKLCHYVQDGRDYFHDLSSDDPRYDPEQTDAKYDQAEPQGWPACATIARASPAALTLCQGCRFNGQGQSPINFATHGDSGTQIQHMNGHANGHTGAVALLPMADDPILLPPGYHHSPDRYVVTDDGQKVFNVPIHKMSAEWVGNQVVMHFGVPRGTNAVDDLHEFNIPMGLINSPQEFSKLAFNNGLTFDPPQIYTTVVRPCLASWVERVRERREMTEAPRMGWIEPTGKIEGFAYGGQIFGKNGPRLSTLYRSEVWMMPRGDLAKWKENVGMVIGRGIVELDCLAATTFAAPLVRFTPFDGLIVFGRSSGTGKGKSVALEMGLSVWFGKLGKITGATIKSVIKHVNSLNNLPAFFDELGSDPSQQKQLATLILQLTAGVDPMALMRSGDQRKRETSRTMVVAAANDSLREAATRADTDAQGARILEIEIPPDGLRKLDLQPDRVAEVKNMLANNHYGVAGMVYAEALGRHHEQFGKWVMEEMMTLHRELHLTERDRFWEASAATVLVGARIAKALGLMNFDIVSMEKFMRKLLRAQRVNLDSVAVDADDPDVQLDRVSEFLNRYKQDIIQTRDQPLPKQGNNRSQLVAYPKDFLATRESVARICNDWMLVSYAKYVKWLRLPENSGINAHHAIRVLTQNGSCIKSTFRRSLGAGLIMHHPPVQEYVLQFDLSKSENARFLNVE